MTHLEQVGKNRHQRLRFEIFNRANKNQTGPGVHGQKKTAVLDVPPAEKPQVSLDRERAAVPRGTDPLGCFGVANGTGS